MGLLVLKLELKLMLLEEKGFGRFGLCLSKCKSPGIRTRGGWCCCDYENCCVWCPLGLAAAVTSVAWMLSCSLWFHLGQCLSCGM